MSSDEMQIDNVDMTNDQKMSPDELQADNVDDPNYQTQDLSPTATVKFPQSRVKIDARKDALIAGSTFFQEHFEEHPASTTVTVPKALAPGRTINLKTAEIILAYLHGEDMSDKLLLKDSVPLLLAAKALGIASLEARVKKVLSHTLEQQLVHISSDVQILELTGALRELYDKFGGKEEVGNEVVEVVAGAVAKACSSRLQVLRKVPEFKKLLREVPGLAADILDAGDQDKEVVKGETTENGEKAIGNGEVLEPAGGSADVVDAGVNGDGGDEVMEDATANGAESVTGGEEVLGPNGADVTNDKTQDLDPDAGSTFSQKHFEEHPASTTVKRENTSPTMDEAAADMLPRAVVSKQERVVEESGRPDAGGRQGSERRPGATTLEQYLVGCHVYIHKEVKVRPWASLTEGDPSEIADGKKRPNRITPWRGFPERQKSAWDTLVKSDFAKERRFNTLSALRENGRDWADEMLGSEWDVRFFHKSAVTIPVSKVIKCVLKDGSLPEQLGLGGLQSGHVSFENHGDKLKVDECCRDSDTDCVYYRSSGQEDEEGGRGVLVMEFKAPTELTLEIIKEGLARVREDSKDIVLEDVLSEPDGGPNSMNPRRLVAAIVTQAFSYMVTAGVGFGYVSTGEAFIFLQVLEADLTTVHCHLSVPREDVGDTLGWSDDGALRGRDDLHLTAVAQALVFTLLALRFEPWAQDGREDAMNQLSTWGTIHQDVPDDSPSTVAASSHGAYPTTRAKTDKREFCTTDCIRGLVQGRGDLDRDCPNVDEHGVTTHRITKDVFLAMMRDQLSRTLDSDFKPCGRPGSRGVPFKATLASHGYTVIAKCTPADFVADLRHEADIYEHLRDIQGTHVPFHLGNLDLGRPYYYLGIAQLVHVMFLGYGGAPIDRQGETLDPADAGVRAESCVRGLMAIHGQGVLHQDVAVRNILWDSDRAEATFIDFERAKIRKRKQKDGPSGGPFAQEMVELRGEFKSL